MEFIKCRNRKYAAKIQLYLLVIQTSLFKIILHFEKEINLKRKNIGFPNLIKTKFVSGINNVAQVYSISPYLHLDYYW